MFSLFICLFVLLLGCLCYINIFISSSSITIKINVIINIIIITLLLFFYGPKKRALFQILKTSSTFIGFITSEGGFGMNGVGLEMLFRIIS